MMNKKRLAALALSAVMVASTMSFPVYAADFSDGGNAEVTTFTAETAAPVVDETEDVESVGATSEGYVLDADSVVFHYNEEGVEDFTVTFDRVSPDGTKRQQYTTVAKEGKRTAATCKGASFDGTTKGQPGLLWMTVEIDGQTFWSGDVDDTTAAFVIEDEPGLEHDWEKLDNEGYVIDQPTCEKGGKAHYYYKCKRCGETEDADVNLEPLGHSYGENKVKYEDLKNVKVDEKGNPVLDADGNLQLADIRNDASYTEVVYHVCDRCKHEEEVSRTPKVIYAEQVYKYVITAEKGIKTDILNKELKDIPANVYDLALDNCEEDGWYEVTTYALNEDGTADRPVSYRRVPVPAHHMESVAIEFANQDDYNTCDVTFDEDGNYTVKNNSCWKTITYYEVTHCTNGDNCPEELCDGAYVKGAKNHAALKKVSSVSKEAEPQGNHIPNTTAENTVKGWVKAGTTVKYADIEKLVNSDKNYITMTTTATCEKEGVTTITFLCKVCKAKVSEYKVKTGAMGHVWNRAVEENRVEATCQARGHYEAVIYCDRCNAEKFRRTVYVPRLKHSNEKFVTDYGIGTDDKETDTNAYIKFFGDKVVDVNGEIYKEFTEAQENGTVLVLEYNWAGAYGSWTGIDEFMTYTEVLTNCTMCNDHEVVLNDDIQYSVKLTVVSVEKQKESGEAGSITLKAEYTKADGKTVTAETTVPYFTSIEAYMGRVEDASLNGLHQDKDGVWRYYKDDVFQADYTGFVEYAGRTFYVSLGTLEKVTDLIIYENEWYYLVESELVNYNGVVLYDGEWFYVTNGRLDTTVNGIVPYDGAYFVFVEGRLQTKETVCGSTTKTRHIGLQMAVYAWNIPVWQCMTTHSSTS